MGSVLWIGNRHFGRFLAAVLAICVLAGCTSAGLSAAAGPTPTPTVDLARARQAFDAGGELTYDEVIALRKALLGPWPDSNNFLAGGRIDFDKLHAAERKYH